MNNEIDQIVAQVMARILAEGRMPSGLNRVQKRSGTLILTERPEIISELLKNGETAQKREITVFIGGNSSLSVEKENGIEVLRASDQAFDSGELAEQFDEFFLAGITLPTLSRLAHFILSDPLVEIAFNALCGSKIVILDQSVRNTMISKLPAGIKRELYAVLSKLKSYGVREERISSYLNTGMIGSAGGMPARDLSDKFKKQIRVRILTVQDLQDLADPSGTVRVSGPFRLTDLAREYAELHNINIELQ